MRYMSKNLFRLIFWLALAASASAGPLAGCARPTNSPVDILSRATRTPVTVAHHWILRQRTFGFPPGTELTLYNSGLTRVRLSDGAGLTSTGTISPDGKWFMFSPFDYDDTLFASMTGAQTFSRHSAQNRNEQSGGEGWHHSVWMPDSDHWARMYRGYNKITVVIRSLRNPSYRHVVPLGRPQGIVDSWDGLTFDLLGALDNARILALAGTYPYGAPVTHAHLCAFTVTGPHPHMHPYEVLLPARSGDNLEAALSPTGGKLAWLLSTQPGGSSHQGDIVTLVVCQADGTGMVTVGEMKLGQADREWPHALSWLPDSKHVQFVYRGSLWVVPIETSKKPKTSH